MVEHSLPGGVDDVIITEELKRRPSRAPDYKAEASALGSLARELADHPKDVLQKLTDVIIDMGIGGSAGISLREGDRFRWDAISGAWARLRGEGMPFDASPCGIVVSRNEMMLFERPERLFEGNKVDPLIREALLVPFYAGAEPVGTVWILAHDDRKFDLEDARILQKLSAYASAAYQMAASLQDAQEAHRQIERANDALATSEVRLRLAMELAGLAVFEIDRETREYIVPEVYALFGLSGERVSESEFLQILDPEDRARFVDAVSNPGGGSGNLHKYQFHMPDGTNRSFEKRARFIDAGGKASVLVVIQDISERVASEQDAARREEHLRSILATIPDAMIVVDERGSIVSFSTAAERMFGYREQEVLGKNVKILMPSPDRERHDEYLERYLRTGERRIIGLGRVTTAQRADGSDFSIELSVGEAHSNGTRIFTGFIQDLTDRQEAEGRLQELQSELIHASRLSVTGTMASTLAHELNQPLTAIANYVSTGRDLLSGDHEDVRDLLREALDEAASESVRAGQIVRRLRDFISRGEVEKSIEPLPRLLEEATALSLVGAREKGIRIEIHSDPNAGHVLANRVQIQQVLVNLIRNAVEAMDGCPRRELCIETRVCDPDAVQIIVADTGPGLPPEVQDNLFQPFVSTKAHGMGLGLSICRTIVDAHGGELQGRRNSDGGTTFEFSLPRVQMEERG